MSKSKYWQISVTLVLFVLGIFLSLQFKTQQDILESLASQKPQDLVAMWKSLNEKRTKLQNEIRVLAEQHRVIVEQASQGEAHYHNMQNDINKMLLINGRLPAQGPGISPVLAVDLIDLINELWASGAEAITINEHRIVATTAITQVEDSYSYYIAIDGDRIYYPIIISAIGDKNSLEKGLTFPGGIIDNLNSFSIFPKITKWDEITIPATKHPLKLQYSKMKE